MDLSKMSLAEMRELQEKLEQETKKREQEEVAKAREQILAIAQRVGIPLNVLMGGELEGKPRVVKGKGRVKVRYRHPSDASAQWSGRGRQPQWVREWLASGKPLEALQVHAE